MLSVSHIHFAYTGRRILEDVSFDVDTGDIVALTGVNGAGKTTLLRVVAGLLTPSSGNVELDRVNAFDEPLRFQRMFGYLSEACPLYEDMTVKSFLKYRAAIKGERTLRVRYRVNEAAEICGLTNLLSASIAAQSKGVKKRIALADALLLRPRLLLLDDVFAGIDGESRTQIIAALKTMASSSCIVFTGHEREEIVKLATREIVLQGGTVA